jgi:hypothetical protein
LFSLGYDRLTHGFLIEILLFIDLDNTLII